MSTSGTTPSISGFTGTLLVTIVASSGNVKVTTTSNLLKASGYCGYTSDASSEPTDCSGNSLDEVGLEELKMILIQHLLLYLIKVMEQLDHQPLQFQSLLQVVKNYSLMVIIIKCILRIILLGQC